MAYAAAYGVMAIAAGFSAYSSVKQGQSQAAWNKYNAQVAKRNAKAAKAVAEAEAARKRRETQRLLGRQRAVYGKAGVTFEGSPLLVMEDTAAEGELDELLIKYRGLSQSQAYSSQVELDRMKANWMLSLLSIGDLHKNKPTVPRQN
ncbi:hypothetical protein J7J13_00265 [bacterium]|nr:hypothetical protein [bacterium]